jgi:hypothetical protein
VFENRARELTGGCRERHYEELRDMFSSPSIITIFKSKRVKLTGHVARRLKKRNEYKLLVGKLEGKRLLGRTRYR